MSRQKLLIVDDEPDLRWVLRGLFEDDGFAVEEAEHGRQALERVRQSCADGELPDVVLSDMRMPELSGIELLRELHRDFPDLPVVLLSAVEDLATAVDAVKEGAFDYQAKPFDEERLKLAVQRAAEQHALRRELGELRRASRSTTLDFGPSRAAQELRRTLELVAAQATVSVLITGESGTGKEVAARAIHQLSPRSEGPFVAVDCGALPEQLLESQLFGHVKGAFTGADRDHPGLFVTADGGTLFLDELGNLPLPLQAKLLRALQERQVVPLGGSEPVPFDARLLTATNASLEDDVQNGSFRIDLFHRIAEFTVPIPPLRQRPEDIVHFARLFLREANLEMGRRVQGFRDDGEQALRRHPWPGNLRELRNAVRRMVLLANGDELGSELLPAGNAGDATARHPDADDRDQPLAQRLQRRSDALEAEILSETLARCDGNKAAAARELQIDYTTMHRKLKRHGIEWTP